MRSGVFSREVISETIEYIPIDGISFPILVSTDNPPYSDMSVTLSLNSGAKASINYKQLNFTRTQKVVRNWVDILEVLGLIGRINFRVSLYILMRKLVFL